MKNKCPHLRSALHNTSTASKEHLAHVKQVAHTHTCVTLGLWVWMNQGCGDLALHHAIFYLMFRPAPPLDMCKLKGKLAKRLDHELMFSSQYGNCALRQKGDKQVQHVLWPVHFFQDCPAPKPLKEEALIVSTHEDTWAQFRKCYSLLTCKNSLMYSYSLQSEHMSFSNTCADDASKCGQM